tara:strand:- start:2546 stop:3235 length:690 start_codon:yes stop_codon:yes gene_type:complete
MTDIKSYTSHNFSAVNEQIKQISKRERARTFSYWMLSLRTMFLYAAVIALIVILLMLSFSWAYRIINAPYVTEKTEVVRPEIIEREVLKVVQVPVEKSILDSSDSGYKGPNNKILPSNNSKVKGSQSVNVITNYNTFNRANTPQFASNGFNEVITGWRYTNSETKYPEYQYCYIQKSVAGRSTTIRADLAAIAENGEYRSRVDSALAKDVAISQKVLREAESYCQWASA